MKLSFKNLVLIALMLISAGLGARLRPTINMADELPPINLGAMVPTTFGEWKEQVNITEQIINPQQKQMLDKLYSETLSRTYVDRAGYSIMLTIAYGKNQSDTLAMHKPEVCYPAQGFTLLSKQPLGLDIQGSPIAITRLTTSLGQRFEPITYWTVVGDRIITGTTSKKLAEINYALHNRIPDGMLVRLSSIDKVTDNAFAIQAQFANQLAQAIPVEHRRRFVGAPTIN